MRRLQLTTLFLFLSTLRVFAATPVVVSGTMQSAGAIGAAGNSYVMFRLRNYQGFVPRIQGTSIIADTEIKCGPPSCLASNGHFSIPLWSNSDIVPNTCGATNAQGCTWYTVEFWVNGALKVSGNYCVLNTNPAMDLNSTAPCQTPPLPPGPQPGSATVTLQTNGVANSIQSLLNLKSGSNINLVPAGDGSVTISSSAGGGVGDALLHPGTAQLFQPTAPTVPIHFQCPTGAANGFTCYDFQDTDGSNLFSIKSGGIFVFKDGISGHWLAQYFGNSTGTLAATGVFRLANTDVGLAWRNNAGTGDCAISKDNTDLLNISGCSGLKLGTSFFLSAPSMTAGEPVSSTAAGTVQSSPMWVDASALTPDAGGDDCKTLNNAIVLAASLGNIDVHADGIKPGLDKACITDPIPDSYAGTIYLGAGTWWVRSNAAQWTLHSRVRLVGTHESRGLSGPGSGTMIRACNNDNSACGGATYNPDAGALCKDGAGTTVHCALITWSTAAGHGLPTTQMFGTTVENLSISCNTIANCYGISAGMFPISGSCSGKCGPQENSFIKNVRIEDFGNGGRAIKLMPGTSNFQVDGINALNEGTAIADCTNGVAIDVLFDATITANGPKRIDNVTNTNGGCVINPTNAVLLDAGEVGMRGIHVENTTDASILVGSRSNAFGFNLSNVNGVGTGAAGAVIRFASGHSIGGIATGTLNINPSGYVIKDDYHGKLIPVTCQSLSGIYAFGTGITDPVTTDAPCLPLSNVVSAPWIATGASAMNAGMIVKLVAASGSFQITTTGNTTDTKEPLGIVLATITDTTTKVPVAIGGIVGLGGIPGPTVDTGGSCSAGDFVYYGTTTDGNVLCSTLRPYNMGIVGRALNTATAGQVVGVLVRPEPTLQPVTGCTGTGVNPVLCATVGTSKNVGTIACPHSTSASTCTINTNAVQSNSVIIITRTLQLGTGVGQCENAMTETANSIMPVASLVAGTSFTINVPTLPTASSQFCINYQIINP